MWYTCPLPITPAGAGQRRGIRLRLVLEVVVAPPFDTNAYIVGDAEARAAVVVDPGGRALDIARSQLNAVALGGVVPNLTFLCLLPPEAGRARLAGRARAADRLDRESLAFHRRVYEAYQAMAASGDDRYCVVDAAASPAAMLEQALARLRRLEHGLLKYV